MRRILVVTLIAVLVLAGCSGSETKKSADAPPSPEAEAKLLTIGDLPDGWTVDKSDDGGEGSKIDCLAITQAMDPSAGRARVSFMTGGGSPSVTEVVAVYADTTAAEGGVSRIVKLLDGCENFEFEAEGVEVSGQIGPMKLSGVEADEVHTYKMTAEAAGQTVTRAMVVTRQGDSVALFDYLDLGSIDLEEAAELANLSADKLKT